MDLKKYVRDVPDFPKKGILFKDITPLLQNPVAFKQVIDSFYELTKSKKVDAVVSVESRGFIFGAPLALKLGCAFIPVRKPGKLPWKTISETYEKEYGADTLCMHQDAFKPGARVLIVDDLLATGGTISAVAKMVERLGAKVEEILFVIELDFLRGRDALKKYKVSSLIHF